jgi:hypothetical protein
VAVLRNLLDVIEELLCNSNYNTMILSMSAELRLGKVAATAGRTLDMQREILKQGTREEQGISTHVGNKGRRKGRGNVLMFTDDHAAGIIGRGQFTGESGRGDSV